MTRHWVSCLLFTAGVTTDEHGRIVETAPIVRRFVGQPLANLLRWAGTRGGLVHECWPDHE